MADEATASLAAPLPSLPFPPFHSHSVLTIKPRTLCVQEKRRSSLPPRSAPALHLWSLDFTAREAPRGWAWCVHEDGKEIALPLTTAPAVPAAAPVGGLQCRISAAASSTHPILAATGRPGWLIGLLGPWRYPAPPSKGRRMWSKHLSPPAETKPAKRPEPPDPSPAVP